MEGLREATEIPSGARANMRCDLLTAESDEQFLKEKKVCTPVIPEGVHTRFRNAYLRILASSGPSFYRFSCCRQRNWGPIAPLNPSVPSESDVIVLTEHISI